MIILFEIWTFFFAPGHDRHNEKLKLELIEMGPARGAGGGSAGRHSFQPVARSGPRTNCPYVAPKKIPSPALELAISASTSTAPDFHKIAPIFT